MYVNVCVYLFIFCPRPNVFNHKICWLDKNGNDIYYSDYILSYFHSLVI